MAMMDTNLMAPSRPQISSILPFDADANFAKLEAKRDAFMDARRDIETVVVGSSHGDHGVDPALIKDSFNLCTTSQDLHQSAMMYA
ncbi:hypothetical protein ACRBEV_29445 [Methylobacterium phyllosphaerae]